MSRWLAWIVWCVVLALPLQGLASGARLICHHAAPVSGAPQAVPCHGEDTAAAADPAPAHAGCIACAACHGAAALPSQPPVLAPLPPAAAPAARHPVPALPYITAGPERPPRTDLA